jgi:hypothetical protein
MALTQPTGDFQTTVISTGSQLAAAGTTMTIGTGLTLPATNGVLQIDYDSTEALGAASGPETISYAAYNSGTGAITGMTRGLAGTTGVTHENGASVQCGPSAAYTGNAFITSADVGAVLLNANLATTAGEPGGAWKDWTPTFTNCTTAASTVVAKYTQIGKTIHFRISVVFAGGNKPSTSPTFTLPVTATSINQSTQMGHITLGDTGTASRAGVAFYSTTTTCLLRAKIGDTFTDVSATVPHTWADTDVITIVGTYEAA